MVLIMMAVMRRLMDGFVGFIAVSVILPMFKLSSTVH